jgi:3-hydroxyacyl-[acyl-carrier-protein] dehydratase
MPVTNDPLFRIIKMEHTEGSVKTILDINKSSEIFKGHFPDRPIVPGACMLQIVKEVVEITLGSTLMLKKANHLKFISMIEPATTDFIQLDISYKIIDENTINVSARLINAGAVCFKFQGVFVSG